MSLARLVVTAVVVEGRPKAEVARTYGISRTWVHELVRRYLTDGDAGLEPRSRRPHSNPARTSQAIEDEIVALRKHLVDQGLDAGAATIAAHLHRRHGTAPATSTIWRILSRRGFVTPQPQKRPKASLIRFQADQPNERWQADITHWQLADRRDVEILDIIDDHSRLAIASHTRARFNAAAVVDVFDDAFTRWGLPASVLTDIHSQWRGLHRRPPRPRPGRPRTPPVRAAHPPDPLPRLPPADLRQGRTLPPDPQTPTRRTGPLHGPQPAASPPRHLRRDLQHPPPPPRARPTHAV